MDTSNYEIPSAIKQPNYVPPGYITLIAAYNLVGKYLFQVEWTGIEFELLRSFRQKIIGYVDETGMWRGTPYYPEILEHLGYHKWRDVCLTSAPMEQTSRIA